MRFALLCIGLVFAGCETDEVREWERTRATLQRRKAELELLGKGPVDEAVTRLGVLRDSMDLPAFLREHQSPAKLFVEPGVQRVVVTASVAQCRDVLSALAAHRWLLGAWRLRLEGDRCQWEGRTGSAYAHLDALLQAPARPAVRAPAHQVFSRSTRDVEAEVARLRAEVSELELRLGDLADVPRARQALVDVKPELDELQSQPAPCDLSILERELALDEGERGKLLEIQHDRMVHPLEPKTDFRLRGLLELIDDKLVWHCEAK